MCHIDSMSMLEIDDMIRELGYSTPHDIYWQKSGGVLKVSPLKSDSDVLSMLAALPRQKYVHVYLEEIVEPLTNSNVGTKTIRTDENATNDEVCDHDSADNRSNGSTDNSSSEDADYVACSDHDSDSPLEDSENNLADSGDEVCDVHVGVGRDIPGFSAAVRVENEDVCSETDSEGADSLHSASDSETDGKGRKYPEFNSETDLKNPQFKKGMMFSHQSVLKAAVKQYAVLNRYNVRLKTNDSRRLQVVCKDGCPWMIWASRLNPKIVKESSWQIKTYIGQHTCIRDTVNANCTSTWLAKTYMEKWRVDPTYSSGSLQKDVENDHILHVPLTKCCRAKKLALKKLHGDDEEQYTRIYDYLGELRGTNPGTTTICRLDNRVFERMYVCLQACKDGFKAGCRRIICVNGCFLKGHYQGYLLAAIGIDGNDCIYPLAYVVVESENTSSWSWFFQILEEDLEINNSHHYTFMSDKQKGLIQSISELFPNAERRGCVRHLYSNFKNKKGFTGKALKDALWKAARATYMKEFTDAMHEMKAISEDAFDWMQDKDPRLWSKSHFETHSKFDLLLNNLCESFNKMILEARDKPILTLMEMVRCKIMNKFAKKVEDAQKIVGTLCPKIQKKVDKFIVQSVRCWPRNAGGNRYEVPAGHDDQHIVDLGAHSCSCRKWDLTGIPCIHATTTILMRGERPEAYVNNCYKKETQLQIYSHMVKPLRGPKQWAHHVTNEPILPPIIRRPVGRP
ncbi:hypothetical protein HRI_001293200 [Hibiscus trionum]|uniref:SWIM-type domain-containing protein n=1 Tax=Hibiscus trionum TaxID=183268 RepID=A0A9W7HF01_HIBTR|nr:hypothetical protein HRI_001293200 [Hibiscus trionum]